MKLRLSVLAAALALQAFAQAAPSIASTAPTEDPTITATRKSELQVARNGKEIIVSWVLPKTTEVKQFEIFRNTRDQAAGRVRAATVRTEPAVYFDAVAETDTTYWYWLKITLKNGQVVNVGPVSTPHPQVWTP